jgi:4-amino-4-deoxy-L-arabinose transferase-like glycosyltransferase
MFKNLFKEKQTGKDGPGGLTRHEIIYLICVVAFALALRFVYHFEMRDTLLARSLQLDEQFHDRWARSIAAGDVIGKGVFFRAPLYPYILGLLYAVFGASAEIPRIIQHLLGGGSIILIYLFARSLFGKKAAVLSSVLGASYAVMIYFEGRLLFDFPVTFLILLWLTLAVHYAERPSWQRYAMLGVLFGLICTMRPPFLGIAPLLFGYLIWNDGKNRARIARSVVPLVSAFLIPILIVTARNALVGGDFVLLASQGGINFYIGNNPLSDGCTPSVPEAGGVAWENRNVQYIAEQAAGHPLAPSGVSMYWYSRGWEFIRGMPLAAVELVMRKFYLFWSHIEISNNLSYYSFERSSAVLTALPVGFWLLGSLGLAGAIHAWRERRARLPLLFMWSYCAITVAFFVCDRFRLPIVPLLCVFSGYTLQFVTQLITARRWGPSILFGLLIAGSALLVNTNILQLRPEIRLGEEELQAGAAMESGDLAKAAELFGRVAALDQENPGARVNQGNALWRMGKTREAI